jgi:hypothetical protein
MKFFFLMGVITLGVGLGSVALAQENQAIPRADMARASIADAMNRAADKAGVSLYTEKMVVVTRGDTIIASVPTTDDEKGFLFVYVSFAEQACARAIPSGFYTVKGPAGKGGRQAHFIDSSGKVAIVARLEQHERNAFPDEKDQLEVGVQIRHLERPNARTARTIVGVCKCRQIHKRCHQRWKRLHSEIV